MNRLTAVILCGGLGRRLRKTVKGRPKPMAEVGGRPFLDLLIDRLRGYGIKRVVLCAGYKAGCIEKYYADADGVSISVEKKALGTAGAVRHARAFIKGSPFLVLNGDSFCAADLRRFHAFHLRKKALASVALTRPSGRDDVGSVRRAADGRITDFSEKGGSRAGKLVNAGIYLFDRKVLGLIPDGRKYSLEYDLFPGLENCYGFLSAAGLLDIGTPGRYRAAAASLKKSGHL